MPSLSSARRGSTMTLAIMVSTVMTGLIATMAWVAGEAAQRTAGMNKMDQAFYAAEAAAQRVQWYCKQDRMDLITSPLTGSLNGYSYTVSWTAGSHATINVIAV